MAQTAVEWLVEQIKSDQNQKALSPNEWMQVIEQAKAMEKEQSNEIHKLKAIIEFYEQGCGIEGCKATEPHVH
jgi:hypothetical protein